MQSSPSCIILQPNHCPYCKQPVSSAASQPAQATQATRATPVANHPNTIYGNQLNPNLQNGNWGGSSILPTLPQNYATHSNGANLPGGVMSTKIDGRSLPGYDGCNTIVINYNIPTGVQQVRFCMQTDWF